MAATRLIAMHVNKQKTVEQCLKARTEYAKNDLKTENGEYVTSYECDVKTADEEFALSKREYENITGRKPKGDIIAYQIRQSFKPGEVTPEEANEVGYETAMRFTKGKHAFIVATHTDKEHIHNHIIYNSTTLDCTRKFNDFFYSGLALRRVSDLVCLEHGLSVIIPKKPSEREKRTDYPTAESFRGRICKDIDEILARHPASYEEFLQMLIEKDYEIKSGKYTSVKGKEQKRFIRLRSLGQGYTEDDILKLIAENQAQNEKTSKSRLSNEREFDMLLDIQNIIAKGKGVGYERWAKVFNIKQISKVLLFLQEHDCRDYGELEKRAESSAKRFAELTAEIKSVQNQMDEIKALREQIVNYAKTRDIYIEYRKSGYSKKYYEDHREEITIHKAAKAAFSSLKGKKLPKIKELNTQMGELIKQKRALYDEYKTVRQEMKDYQTAKYDIDRLLNHEEENQTKDKKKEQSL